MDEERARALLGEQRQRLERLLASVDADHDRVAPADEVAEDLADGADRRTSEETDEAVARQLDQRMQALQRAEWPFAEAVERAADGEDHPGRDPGRLEPARLGPSHEPFQVLQDPAVQDNPLVEDDDTTFDEPPPEHDPALPDAVTEDDTGRIQPLP